MLISCATTGRKEHGTSRTNPDASPFTVQEKWDYYRNLTANDLERGVNLGGWLADWRSWVNYISCDLYFVGLRQGGPKSLDTTLTHTLDTRYAMSASAKSLRRGLKTRLFGDLRFREEGQRYPAGNDNTGAFPNFNAINTGAPFRSGCGI